jgi:uncharacterized protein
MDNPETGSDLKIEGQKETNARSSFDVRGFGGRFYREKMGEGRFRSFIVRCKDSDLWIGIDPGSYRHEMESFAFQKLIELRYELESYIHSYPGFQTSFVPVTIRANDPAIAVEMAKAGKIAGTGPMAAVAGAFSEFVGKALQKEFNIDEIVVENGGDIYLKLKCNLLLSVYAGESSFTGKLGVEIPASVTPLGICTSSGTVGPSISFGKADAVVIASKCTALADAYATAYGNRVKCSDDIPVVIKHAKKDKRILSAVIVCEGKAGICGQFNIKPIFTL